MVRLRTSRVSKIASVLSMAALVSGLFGSTAYMEANYVTPTTAGTDSDIVQVATMTTNNLAFLTADGHVYVNGDNSKGQYGNGTTDTPSPTDQAGRFVKVNNLTGIDRIYATQGGSLYAWDQDSETLYSWGDNGFLHGGVGGELSPVHKSAKVVDFLGAPIHFAGDKPQSLEVTYGTTFAIDTEGKVWSWGQATTASATEDARKVDFRLGREVSIDVPVDTADTLSDSNGNGIINLTQAFVSSVPGIVPYPAEPDEKAVAIAGGNFWANYILTDKGNLYLFGGTNISPDPDHRFRKIAHPAAGRKWTKLSVSSGGAALLLDDAGQLYTMNVTDTTVAQSTPVKPAAIYGDTGNPAAAASVFTKVTVTGAKNQATFLAATDDGKVYVWGRNINGVSAIGHTSAIASAVENPNLEGADDFGALTSTGAMLKRDDAGKLKLYTWGSNISGQLGNGSVIASSTPVEVLPDFLTGTGGPVPDPNDKPPTPPPPLPNPLGADFMINKDRVLVDDFVGWGSQYNQALYADITQHEYGTTPENVGDLENKVIRLGSQHVRIFYDPDWWLVRNYDNKDPSKGTTVTDPNAESFIKTVELAQRTGSSVNVTYWHPLDTPDDEEMQQFANFLYDLIVNKGLTAIQEVTIFNEPNNDNNDLAWYESFYRYLDSDLKALGIRDRIKLVGGDLVNNFQQTWLEYMAYNMGDVLDAFSVHIYWDYWDMNYAKSRLASVRGVMNKIPYSKQKPIYITEFGVRGYKIADDPRYSEFAGASTPVLGPDTVATVEMPLAAFEHAWFNLQAANLGFVATVRWDAYQAKYDSGRQNFSMIGKGQDGYPIRPGYDQLRLMAATTKPGWQVIGAEAKSPSTPKVAAALLGPNGEQTLFALNNTGAATTISMAGLAPGQSYYAYNWNKNGDSAITYEGIVTTDANGMMVVTVGRESYAALTTAPVQSPLTAQPEEAVVLDKAALMIGYQAGDTQASVTQSVYLPSYGANGTTIAWSSSDPHVIRDNGRVKRPPYHFGDADVTLTATIAKSEASETRTFVLHVLSRQHDQRPGPDDDPDDDSDE